MSQPAEQTYSSEALAPVGPASGRVARSDLARVALAGTALAVSSLTLVGTAVRFWRIGSQSYWEDEAVTVHLVHQSLGTMLVHGIPQLETTPPLYYVLAWVWTRLFGSGEVALRSLSALLGTALVPVAFAVGRTLVSRRAGLATAALAAFSPPLVWYSQEARAYSLLVLTTGLSLLFFARLWRVPSRNDAAGWAVCSALALASQYFAAIPVALEALLLVTLPRTRRRSLPAVAGVGAVGLLLAPLALDQRSHGHAAWIGSRPLAGRARETVQQFLSSRYPLAHATWLAAAAAVAALALLALPADRRTRRGGLLALGLGAGFLALAIVLALAGFDYFLYRNLLPAWLPLALAAAAALSAIKPRGLGAAVVAVLCLGGLIAVVDVARRPDLQRDDWRGAAQTLGAAPAGGRVVLVSPPLTRFALERYRPETEPLPAPGVRVRSLDLLVVGAPDLYHLPTGFVRTGASRIQHLSLLRFRAAHPRLVTPRSVWFETRRVQASSSGFSLEWQPASP